MRKRGKMEFLCNSFLAIESRSYCMGAEKNEKREKNNKKKMRQKIHFHMNQNPLLFIIEFLFILSVSPVAFTHIEICWALFDQNHIEAHFNIETVQQQQ